MSTRNLDKLLRPRSLAVVGASNRPGSVGFVLMRNLLRGGFAGPIMPVHPRDEAVGGVLAYRDVKALPITPDLAIIATPPATVSGIVQDLADKGTRATVVLTAGLGEGGDATGQLRAREILASAGPRLLRVVGPNCVGVMVPGIGLNASFAHAAPLPGNLAFLSQSGALCTAVLDHALSRGIGFSHFISLGNSLDVDAGDLLDELGSDPQTHAILLYLESVRHARKFMSAARAAARNKPVLVVKSGRGEEGARAASTHTGALAGADAVFDAAFRRAGMLRVFELEELFDAVETLAHGGRISGDRLAIVTNGGGPAVLATDTLTLQGGKLATLPPATVQALDEFLPPTWSRGNPVDLIGDADDARYRESLRIVGTSGCCDALLVMLVPTAIVDCDTVARATVDIAKKIPVPVLACWMGGDAVAASRRILTAGGLPNYETPGRAVEAFLHIVRYRNNQQLLMETPTASGVGSSPDRETAQAVIDAAIVDERTMLSEVEAKQVLAAYGIPIVETRVATTPEEAGRVAADIGFPVALKIISEDVVHKSDVGGVDLDLGTSEAVVASAVAMAERVRSQIPDVRISGYSVQRMARMKASHELIVGVSTDPVFGPVIVFGEGGKAVDVVKDSAIALPPLNDVLARELIRSTRIARVLEGYRDMPPIDEQALIRVLIQVSALVADNPHIVELDINPLLASPAGSLALDARIKVSREARAERLAIRPYPHDLEEAFVLRNGRETLLRPIRPEDEPKHHELHSRLTPEDIRFRHFGMVKSLPHSQMARYTQIDYDREMAFLATSPTDDGDNETLGVARAVSDPNFDTAEFAVIIRSDLKGQGLGHALLDKLVRYWRERGLRRIVGRVSAENQAMLGLATKLGFTSRRLPDDDTVEIVKDLAGPPNKA